MSTTAVQRSARSVYRIVAIPLTRPPPPTSSSSRDPYGLTFYHFQIHDLTRKVAENPNAIARALRWAQKKAVDTWTEWGKAPEGAWKLKVFRLGERLSDRIDFEELALKGVDPSLGPKITDWQGEKGKQPADGEPDPIPLVYPPSIQSHDIALANLRHLLENRSPRHRRGFIWWAIAAPCMAPFMAIPIIPNLPFFYCAWRSWSHYKAYKASDYINSLIKSGAIIPKPSLELDKFYDEIKVEEQTSSEESPLLRDDRLLISKSTVAPLVAELGLKPDASTELSRALTQAKSRTSKG